MLISVIVTTYNRPAALKCVLEGLAAQTDPEYEVLVGDDGSREETAEMIRGIAKNYPVPLKHVWQEDTGFRLARIRNLAASKASGGYLIFLDGDCVPRGNFVSEHRKLAEKGWIVAGNRILVSEDFTKKVEAGTERLTGRSFPSLVSLSLKGAVNRFLPLVTLPVSASWRKAEPEKWKRVRGCNFALWAADYRKVNGSDESFSGWGFEDSDLAIRLINAGIRVKKGTFATGVFHLYHRENDRSNSEENKRLAMERLSGRVIRASRGIDDLGE